MPEPPAGDGAPKAQAPSARRRWTIGALALYAACCALYATVVVKDFSSPLFGGGDVAYPEYTAYYFSKHLSFTPLPTLDLHNDSSFYPFGTNQAFQPWAIEQDLLLSVLNRGFGPGPWLQLYHLLSLFVGAAGTFLLLRGRYGAPRALLAGFMVSFMNFYCVYKFPAHYPLTIVHWANLSILTDFLLLSRVHAGTPVTLRFASLKLLLILLCAGLELGYVAGIPLLSLALALPAAGVMLLRREGGPGGLLRRLRGALWEWKAEARETPALFAALAVLALLVALFYVGIDLQILSAASEYPDVAMGEVQYSSPLRILLPWLPRVNPLGEWPLGDRQESPGAGSAGWSFLLLSAAGAAAAVKQRTWPALLPAILLLLFVFNVPFYFLTGRTDLPPIGPIGYLPWFRYSRILSRVTFAYPVLLVILGLGARVAAGRAARVAACALLLLATAETTFAYSRLDYTPWRPDRTFTEYMEAVKRSEGEAVLDWPFCIAGGNAVGTRELGPYFSRNYPVFALARFHGKKVVGQFFGRLDQSQIAPFLLAGFDRLFSPDAAPMTAQGQTRCLSETELEFLWQFFLAGDFAGINLYSDLMPYCCWSDVVRKFGAPVAWTRFPPAGGVCFIPKRKELAGQVDVERAKALKYLLPLPGQAVELVLEDKVPYCVRAGFANREGSYRWMVGRESRIEFLARKEGDARIHLMLEKISGGQRIRVEANGTDLGALESYPDSNVVETVLPFRAREGINRIVFRCTDWNGRERIHVPKSSQPLSAKVYRASLTLLD